MPTNDPDAQLPAQRPAQPPMGPRTFRRQAMPVAIDPQAYGIEVATPQQATAALQPIGDAVTVVRVSGVLTFEDGWSWWGETSYGEIRSLVREALQAGAQTVLLCIDSPGGDAFGCFDCARGIGADCAAAGVRLVAYTPARLCSAAYALACAADEIHSAEAVRVGSIGVIAENVDVSQMHAEEGIKIDLITSGARKSDGNPAVPLTDSARAAMQAGVDGMARIFFKWVGERRPNLDAEGVAALQAATFGGPEALAAGLVDSITSYDDLLARLQQPDDGAKLSTSTTTEAVPVPDEDKKDDAAKAKAKAEDDKPEDETRKALAEAAEGDDEEMSAKAKRALAAYDAEDEPAKDEDKSEDKEDDPESEDDSDDSKALAASAGAMAARLAALEAAEARRIKMAADGALQALFASRPDLPESIIKACAGLSLKRAKAIVDGVPKGFANPRVVTTEQPTQGDGSGVGGVSYRSEHAEKLDRIMGLTQYDRGKVVNDGAVQQFGVSVPKGRVS